jgi:hypothetical protein
MKKRTLFAVLLALAAIVFAVPTQQQSTQTERVSVSNLGQEANDGSYAYDISDDGRYVAFSSLATNLVIGDTNNLQDCFVRDRLDGSVLRISTTANGTQANAACSSPKLSGDGRYVTFRSGANNLVPNDTNNFPDIFVKDLVTGALEIVSVSNMGLIGNGSSAEPDISADGRFVVFDSNATNLVPGDTNGVTDIFFRDRLLGTTSILSRSSAGELGNSYSTDPQISSVGNQVGFRSIANNLVPGDQNNNVDIFVHYLDTGATERVSLGDGSVELNGDTRPFAFSDSGDVLAFASEATNAVVNDTNGNTDVFVRNLTTGSVNRISLSSTGQQLAGGSGFDGVSISGDGRFVVYDSQGNNIVPNDTNNFRDVFRYDSLTEETVRVSMSSLGGQANADCRDPRISRYGEAIVYTSVASTLVSNDTNNLQDAFLTYIAPPPPTSSTFLSIGDTYLKEGQPNKNQGTEGILRIRQSGQNRSLVQFDQNAISSFVGTRSVTSATLRVYISLNSNNWGASGRDVGVHRLTSSWTELGATWNCPDDTNTGNNSPDGVQWEMNNVSLWPFVSTASDIVVHTNGLVGWIEFDVTADVQGFLSGNPNYGWLIKKTNEGQSGSVEYSSKDGANPPELIITAQ